MQKGNWNELLKQSRHHLRYPNEYLVSFCLRNFKKGFKVLDLGCGAGRHTKLLAENGFDFYACDYAKSGIEATKELLKGTISSTSLIDERLVVADMVSLPYENEFFDGLVCQGVLMYTTKESLELTVQEIYRILKKGAFAYFAVKNKGDYRYENGIKSDDFNVIINETDKTRSAYCENGNAWHFFDKDEIEKVYSKFSKLEVNEIIKSHANSSYKDSNYEIIVQK